MQEPPAANLAASATPVPPLLPACSQHVFKSLCNASVDPLPAVHVYGKHMRWLLQMLPKRCVYTAESRPENHKFCTHLWIKQDHSC